MTRATPLLLLGLLAACSDLPEMMGPEADQANPPVATELAVGDPILDAIERIAPTLGDRSLELQAALRSPTSDRGAIERILARLDADPAFAPDADAIRLAIANR